MKKTYAGNIKRDTVTNTYYRKIISTNSHQQLVLMCLNPGEDIPMEKHDGSQFIRVEAGKGTVIIGKKLKRLHDDIAVVIPPGVSHYVKNTSVDQMLKMYVIYSPPEHPANTLNRRQH